LNLFFLSSKAGGGVCCCVAGATRRSEFAVSTRSSVTVLAGSSARFDVSTVRKFRTFEFKIFESIAVSTVNSNTDVPPSSSSGNFSPLLVLGALASPSWLVASFSADLSPAGIPGSVKKTGSRRSPSGVLSDAVLRSSALVLACQAATARSIASRLLALGVSSLGPSQSCTTNWGWICSTASWVLPEGDGLIFFARTGVGSPLPACSFVMSLNFLRGCPAPGDGLGCLLYCKEALARLWPGGIVYAVL
jgi:hypothetical protein